MIFGNTNHLQDFGVLQNPIKECFAYLQSHNMLLYEKGSYPIDGDRLFVNIMEYRTTVPEERFWEAHKEYLDVHVALQGREQIDLCFIWKMQQGEYVEYPDLIVNLTNYSVIYMGHSIEMPPKELELLYFLSSSPNQVFTREQLLDHIWGYEYIGEFRTVDVHIRRLREKLEPDPASPEHILTKWGVGYYLANNP